MGELQQLQSLVHELKWSYVALWSFNSQTRNLEWRAGHWRQSDTQGWNEHYFNSTFRSCQFGARFGSVGLAFAERRKLWMNGSKVVDNAGSKELVDFLRRARILTAIIIPWSDGVLELGTSENVPKNQSLVDEIERYLLTTIVPTLNTMLPPMPLEQGYSGSLSPLNYSQSFEPNSLNQQIIRRGSNLSNPAQGAYINLPRKKVMRSSVILYGKYASGREFENLRRKVRLMEKYELSSSSFAFFRNWSMDENIAYGWIESRIWMNEIVSHGWVIVAFRMNGDCTFWMNDNLYVE